MANDKINQINQVIKEIENKEFKILYFTPDVSGTASGGIGVLYQHVNILRALGYDAQILTELPNYKKPEWLGSTLIDVPHVHLKDLKVSYADIVIIPEGFSNVMEQTKDVPCRRVVFCQSWAYVLNALMPAMSWADMNIRDVMVVQEPLKEYLETVFGDKTFDIQVVRPSVSDKLFKPSSKPKLPFIAISSRDQFLMMQVVKQFYLQFPHLKWVSFVDMRDMSREDFASKLGESFLGVWIDRVAGFGTFPIECAKSNTPFIALAPDMLPEYANDVDGIWTYDMFKLADMIGGYVKMWIEDNTTEEVKNSIVQLATKYTEAEEIESVKAVFESYSNGRIAELSEAVTKLTLKIEESEVKQENENN